MSNEPACAATGVAGEVACIVRGIDNGAHVQRFRGGSWRLDNWTGYAAIGGVIRSRVDCAAPAAGRLVCTTVSLANNQLYSNVFDGAAWSGWALMGGAGVGETACARFDTLSVICVTVGVNNKLTSRIGP